MPKGFVVGSLGMYLGLFWANEVHGNEIPKDEEMMRIPKVEGIAMYPNLA